MTIIGEIDATADPLASVIIPTYNRSAYLRLAIKSVLAQTYKNFELLVLDNCSDDDTPNVISEFSDSRIKYLRHKCNIGGAANWIYGIHWAAGGFFSVLGDDDLYGEDFLLSRIEAFKRYDGIQAVFSNYKACDQNGTIVLAPKQRMGAERRLSGDMLLDVVNAQGWQVGATLFKRAPTVEMWDECIRSGKAFDTAVQVQIALKSSAVWIPGEDLIYRLHPDQDSRIGGKGILIGHVNAFSEPLVYEDFSKYAPSLSKGAWWALDILARASLASGDRKVARKIFVKTIFLRPSHARGWIRWLLTFAPDGIFNKIRKWLQSA